MGEIRKFSYETPFLIDSKLHPPRLAKSLIIRNGLLEKLNKGLNYKLTIIAAPAGFGKSTLVAQWVEKTSTATGWLSLDKGDNDVIVFWTYFIHALKTIHPRLGQQALDFLHSSNHHLIHNTLAIVINETNLFEEDFCIILDDFHTINDQSIHASIMYLLKYLPPQFHLLIISRSSPPLPLPSLRGKGYVQEILCRELRFNLEESKDFFQKSLDPVRLPPKELMAISKVMDGWAAGLQMASTILNNFTGKHCLLHTILEKQRYFREYFLEEIIHQQSDTVKQFLLRTSILETMNPSLCDALTQNNTSLEMLAYLEQANLFIIPLDEHNYWYRYHHLFAKTLRSLLQQQEPSIYHYLHQQAGFWYKQNGYLPEAISHTLKAQEFYTAAGWIEEYAPEIFKEGNLAVLASWIGCLPLKLLYQKPRIWLYHIRIMIHNRQWEDVEAACTEMNSFLENDELVSLIEDQSLLKHLDNELHLLRVFLAFIQEKAGSTEEFVNTIQKVNGDSVTDLFTFYPGNPSLLQANFSMRGKLLEIKKFFNLLENTVTDIGNNTALAVGYTILSELFYERNEWQKAQQYFQFTMGLGKTTIDLGALLPAYVTASKIKLAQGEPRAALELLNSLEKEALSRIRFQWISTIQAFRARIAMKMDDTETVQNWMSSCGLSIEDSITMSQHYSFVTFIRGLLYLKHSEEALLLADRMAVIVEEEGGVGQQIEIALLKALCCQNQNQTQRALILIQQALQMGKKEGYYRIFVDEGHSLISLLETYRNYYVFSGGKKYCARFLEYLNQIHEGISQEHKGIALTSHSSLKVVQSITQREWDVLILLAQGLSNQAIARSLYISVVTVKSHVQSIYRKLQVKTRAKALVRINELNLLFYAKEQDKKGI